ncbi:hypothetical protein [Paenibacillus sp. MBLB4367]|uniref:hypothetical protein n=1 Tax=Paenibacillus sp. MBLB4367 TaxID=3384767 RepID=UPI00390803DA
MEHHYLGFGGEHYVISRLFAECYEASKLSVDFGFDVLLSNQYRFTIGTDDRLKTQAIQVKTRNVGEDDYLENEEFNGAIRKKTIKKFLIKTQDLELITNSENGFLVCLFYEKNDIEYNVLGLFWLSASHLRQLIDMAYIRINADDNSKHEITAELKFNSSVNHLAQFCLDELNAQIGPHSNIQELRNIINNSLIIPNNSAFRKSTVALKNSEGVSLQLNRSLTVLKELVNEHPLQIEYDPTDIYIDLDPTFEAISRRKFEREYT